MRSQLLCTSLALLIAASISDAAADTTYTCTAARDKASTGAPDSTSVKVSASGANCFFSVSGAKVDAIDVPPSAFGVFRGQLRDFFLNVQRGEEELWETALSSLHGVNIADFGDRSRAEEFIKCFEARDASSGPHGDDRLFCASAARGAPFSAPGGTVSIASPFGGIAVGTHQGDTTSIIFVPRPLLEDVLR